MRSRHLLVFVAAGLVGGLVAVAIGDGGGGRSGRPRGSRPEPRTQVGTVVSAAAAFAQDPYMGVACHLANSIACDRVGLSVWLRAPASVSATIAGAPVTLNDPHWSYVRMMAGAASTCTRAFWRPRG